MALLAITLAWPADARQPRSATATAQFKKATPCPAKGPGTCFQKGYVIDHTVPLACGGPDIPLNMRWQPIEIAKAKDRWETKGCKTNGRLN